MGNGSICIGPCTPAQRMVAQSSANSRVSRAASQTPGSVTPTNTTAQPKAAGLAVRAQTNSVIDVTG